MKWLLLVLCACGGVATPDGGHSTLCPPGEELRQSECVPLPHDAPCGDGGTADGTGRCVCGAVECP